ncbi:glycosyl hydrolase family 31 [Listeria monocytogenes]|uniref:TIM-barrel domain-containing protein n=1 Tax=Listeria monocytogenes TaxID=1639 RepID=UPI0011EB69B8|nr:TIM-barrel domain-containing protein [Listeria monocytogenes]TYU82729.1 glycosyl hydrolase family 31 [Listeria monocytogenes]
MLLNQEVEITPNSFTIRDGEQTLIVEEWGRDSVRVISSPESSIQGVNNQGIEELEKNRKSTISIIRTDTSIQLLNNDLKVIYDGEKIVFYYKDTKVLEEYSRKQSDVRRTIGIDDHVPISDSPSSSLKISPRTFKFKSAYTYEAILRFEGDPSEKIFGLGGYQEENLDKNLGSYELMQRNSQTTIPFYLSSKNYGFIWNNASIGEVAFSKNQKKWVSMSTQTIDYIVMVGKTPKTIMNYMTTMIGRAPQINQDYLGLWQSKLRYQTIDEIREVYEGYRKRLVNLSVLVIDYFHWTADGDFEFDYRYWKGIHQFTKVLNETKTKLMVSLWPTVSKKSKYYEEYNRNKLVIQSHYGDKEIFDGKEILDFSNPKTSSEIQYLLNRNYRKNGIELFWADQAEPEMSKYDHENYTVYEGEFARVASRYSYHYIKAVQSQKNGEWSCKPVLIRSAWFNSQKYGALAWSGDIDSSFESFRRQIQIGLNMGMSGISWWTSDIAGFHSGNSESPVFKELMIRWFQFSVFSPILRMHGDRQPHTPKIGLDGGGARTSGGPNEIWSFGSKVESILLRFINIREKLKDYIYSVYQESSEKGYPIMRSLFLEFPEDKKAWEETTNFMLGRSLLIVPVVEEAVKEMHVYLPKNTNWIDVFTKEKFIGGRAYNINISIETVPVFCREGSLLEERLDEIFVNN